MVTLQFRYVPEYSIDSSQTPATVGPPITITAAESEPAASTRPPTRQPGTGIRASLLQLTREEVKQQELAVSSFDDENTMMSIIEKISKISEQWEDNHT